MSETISMNNMTSIDLIKNGTDYFPISLVTVDYNKAVNNEESKIERKEGETLHQYYNRIQTIRSDKRFTCLKNKCGLEFMYGTSKDSRALEPRIVEDGRIILNIDQDENKPIMKYSGTEFKLNRIEIFGTRIFGWNNNSDLPETLQKEYEHDGEVHLQFGRQNEIGEFTKDKTSNITIIIGLKSSEVGSPIFVNSLSSQFDTEDDDGEVIGSSSKMKIEEIMPNKMSFFTYTLLPPGRGDTTHRIILLEEFRKVDPIYVERIKQIIRDTSQNIPQFQVMERPLDDVNLGMYGFLKINENSRGTNYESRVYYTDEIRVQYSPNIVESNRMNNAIENVEFNLDLPSDYIVMKREDVKPIGTIYEKQIFTIINSIVFAFIFIFGFVFFRKNQPLRILFIGAFGGLFGLAMLIGLIYVNYSYDYLIDNSTGKDKEEYENKKRRIPNSIVYMIVLPFLCLGYAGVEFVINRINI
jgi:hypothetical protein